MSGLISTTRPIKILLNLNDIEWVSIDLAWAAHQINQKRRMNSLADLKAALGAVPGIETMETRIDGRSQFISLNGKSIQIDVTASPDDIRKAFNIQKINNITSKPMATIGEQLKAARAKLADARDGASKAVAECSDASNVVLQEVEKARKEAADLRAEVAELTNGGPL